MTDIAHSERAHARLSPSGAARFMACPGSIRLSEGIPDKSSIYADEGTAAHELAERCLRDDKDPNEFAGETIHVNGREFEVTPDMISAVRTYLEHVAWFIEKGFEISIEERLDMTHVVDGMFGTADLLAYSEAHQHLFVIDYKHGRGVAVEPQRNKQLMSYAIGALKRYGNRHVKLVTLTVVQPRAAHPKGGIRSWQTTPEFIMEFADELQAAAQIVDEPDAPLVPGDHCAFCKAAGMCPALREQAIGFASDDFDAVVEKGVSADQLADWLDKVGTVEMWCKKVREFANAEGRAGRIPTGYKFVEKRAMRKWKDESKALAALRVAGELTDEELFGEPTLQSVAKIEKFFGKKSFKAFESLVTQQSSGVVLAPESDPRPAALSPAEADFDAQEID